MSPAVSAVRSHRRRFAAFVAAYTAIAVGGLAVMREPAKYEVYPFSAWPLFMLTPANGAVYDLVVVADGVPEWPQTIGSERTRSIEFDTIVQSLGKAIERGRDGRRDELIRQLRRAYLSDVAVSELRVLRRTADPLRRYRDRASLGDPQRRLDGTTPIGRFRLVDDEGGDMAPTALPVVGERGAA